MGAAEENGTEAQTAGTGHEFPVLEKSDLSVRMEKMCALQEMFDAIQDSPAKERIEGAFDVLMGNLVRLMELGIHAPASQSMIADLMEEYAGQVGLGSNQISRTICSESQSPTRHAIVAETAYQRATGESVERVTRLDDNLTSLVGLDRKGMPIVKDDSAAK